MMATIKYATWTYPNYPHVIEVIVVVVADDVAPVADDALGLNVAVGGEHDDA